MLLAFSYYRKDTNHILVFQIISTILFRLHYLLLGAIVTYTLWLIYDLYAKSYSGAITNGLIIISNLYILIFRKDDKEVIVSKTPIIK